MREGGSEETGRADVPKILCTYFALRVHTMRGEVEYIRGGHRKQMKVTGRSGRQREGEALLSQLN